MYIDKETMLSEAQVVTVTAASTNHINLGAASNLGVPDGPILLIRVDEAATAAGAATLEIKIECDSSSAFSSPSTLLNLGVIGKADLTLNKQFYVKLPYAECEQYVRAYYTVATGPLTAGKFTIALVESVQASKAYPANF